MSKYSLCESVTGIGPWHIRKLTKKGPMYGGGIDTASLCGLVGPVSVCNGWDINVEITEHHLGHCCPKCVKAYRAYLKAHPG